MSYREGPGEMTVTYCGFDFRVKFDYTPEEPADHYGPAPYPGAPEQLEIHEVLIGGEPIEDLLKEEVLDDLAEKILEMRQ